MTRTTTCIETSPTETLFDFANPKPEMIHVEDIARSLSLQCRFGGFSQRFYSVAEHALLVHWLVRDVAGPELAFAALHHDSHEAYLGDIPTPLKNLLGPSYALLACAIDAALEQRFGVAPHLFSHDIIKAADEQALFIEAAVLKVSRGLGPQWGHARTRTPDIPTGAVACYDPPYVEGLFLATHDAALAAMRVAA